MLCCMVFAICVCLFFLLLRMGVGLASSCGSCDSMFIVGAVWSLVGCGCGQLYWRENYLFDICLLISFGRRRVSSCALVLFDRDWCWL